jgi:hypothetical protein
MTEQSFYNFDLSIEKSGRKYRARVVSSPAGQASGEFNKPISTSDLNEFITQMGRPDKGGRLADSAELNAIKRLGELLFSTVFTKQVYACYLRSLDIASTDNKGLRIRLRIDVPEFHDLPWEYLYDSQRNQFLALSNDTPIVRYFDLTYTAQNLAVEPPLKILVMISSPDEYPKLDVDQHWNRLQKALDPLIRKGLVKLEKLESPTLDNLQQNLRQEAVHVFHYIGHGKYFEKNQDGKLLLEDEQGKGRPVSGQQLATLLRDHDSLRMVVLVACEGARTSAEDPYAGVAQTLVQQGAPAVIAMQFEILEDAAITFAQEFYEAIVDGNPVDAALAEARKAIYVSGNEREWGTPVLFTRSPDSVLVKRKVTEEQTTATDDIASPTSQTPKEARLSLSTIIKNPKMLSYLGVFFVTIVAAIFGGISLRNRAAENADATSSAISQAITSTAIQRDSLTSTQDAKTVSTANAATSIVLTQSAIPTDTATATQPSATPTNTGTTTPITPPLSCLDRWTLKMVTEDTSLSTDPSIKDGCITGYRSLGISTAASTLSFLQSSFGIQGKFGLSTSLPPNPESVSLRVKFTEITGGGQGEFWVTLSNGPDPDKDSMSIAIQPNGSIKYFQDDDEITRHTIQPRPSSYIINFDINGINIASDINSSASTLRLPINGGPNYLFLGYSKKATGGTITLQISIQNLEFK